MLNRRKIIIFYIVISAILYFLFNDDSQDFSKKMENNSSTVTVNAENNNSIKKEKLEWNAYLMCKMFVSMKLSPKVSVFPYMERNSTESMKGLLISSTVQTDDETLNWKCLIIYKGGEMKNPNSWDYNLTF